MLNPQMTSSQMELLPLVCLCLLSWSGTTSADQPETVAVGEGGDVILKCSINGVNMETGAFEWTKGQKKVFSFDAGNHHNNGRKGQAEQFKGRVSHFEDELKHGNTSIKITNATMADSGDYTCEFPNNHPSPTFNVKLVVGLAPKPSVTTLDQTENSALLQCKAHGVPDLEVHWQDSDGNILPAEKSQVTERGRKYITLNTTVTKTDHFRCVATQKNIDHTISTEIFVPLPETVVVEEGSDAILPCSFGVDIKGERLEWKKDGQKVLVYNAGIDQDNLKLIDKRLSHFKDELKHGNASLKITNTKMADVGDYTCETPHLQSSQPVHVKLSVGGELKDRAGENIPGAASEPYVTTLKTQDGVLLQCTVRGVSPKPKVEWKDSSGNILPAEEPQVTERGGSYDIILRAPVTKADNFRCVVTQEEIKHQISAEIYAHISGAAPEPSVTTLDETMNEPLLQCEAHGDPDLEVHWQDSAGNILPAEKPKVTERGGLKYITLKTTVTKTDHFSCVATQKKLSHTISSQIYVLLPDNTVVIIIGVVIALLVAVVVGVVFYKHKQKHKKELEGKDRIIEELQEKMKKIDEGLQRINTIISEVQEKIKKVAEELQKIIKRLSEANEEIKTIDEGLQKIKTIISEVQENKMSASAACEEIKKIVEELQKIIKHLSEACEEIKTIDEELQKINTIISAACEEIKTIIEELQKIIKHPSEANEKMKKIDEGSSDHPNESVPLNPLNSSV